MLLFQSNLTNTFRVNFEKIEGLTNMRQVSLKHIQFNTGSRLAENANFIIDKLYDGMYNDG